MIQNSHLSLLLNEAVSALFIIVPAYTPPKEPRLHEPRIAHLPLRMDSEIVLERGQLRPRAAGDEGSGDLRLRDVCEGQQH